MPIGSATYALLTAQVRQRVTNFVTSTWLGLGSWRDEDIERFVARVVPVVAGGQRQIASLTDAYLSEQVGEMFGVSSAARGIASDDVTGSAVRNGADPRDVYRRPAIETYTALKQGLPLDAAVQRGADRIGQLVSTDMQLARTHASRAVLSRSPAQYYRRVLNGSENCALCVVASTQRYKVSNLMPVHTHCDCGIAPIKGNRVPHVLDRTQLEAVHAAVERVTGEPSDRSGRGEIDFRQIMVVRDHGEYGPTLTYRGQAFTGPSDITS